MGPVQAPVEQMLIYVPAAAPITDEEQAARPVCRLRRNRRAVSRIRTRAATNTWHSVITARPDHATAVRSVFAQNPNPDFAVIDAIGGGAGWPQLQALLGVESARDILFALLAPTDDQKAGAQDAGRLGGGGEDALADHARAAPGHTCQELGFDWPASSGATCSLASLSSTCRPRCRCRPAWKRCRAHRLPRKRWWKTCATGCATTSAPRRSTSTRAVAIEGQRGAQPARALPRPERPRHARHLSL